MHFLLVLTIPGFCCRTGVGSCPPPSAMSVFAICTVIVASAGGVDGRLPWCLRCWSGVRWLPASALLGVRGRGGVGWLL